MQKMDDKGFSLLELLIAVCIMAIIIIPLINSFLSSYRVNARGRQTLRATTLAQSEMEIFEKESIEDISKSDEFAYSAINPDGYQVIENATLENNGRYTFARKGIINDDSGRDMFDVYIELDPRRINSGDRYYDENNTDLLAMNTISTLDSGTYVQTIRTANNAVDDDASAYSYFYNNKLPGATWNLDMFKQEVKRVITLDISQYVDGGETYTRAKVTYDYSLNLATVMPADKMKYEPVERMIYDNTRYLDEEGFPIELKSIYLFYAPRYGIVGNDTIVIKNEAGLPIDIYVVRQDLLVAGGNTVQITPATYYPEFKIYDKLNGGKTAATYHTNLNINQTPVDGIGQQVGLTFIDTGVAVSPNYHRNDIIDMTGLVSLGVAERKDRIYAMTVKVYEAGADITAATPLVSLTGTKLE